MNAIKKVGNGVSAFVNKIMPEPDKAADGRDQWPSRTAFILASLSGVIGMGNFLRYPSTVYNNYGIQWFIPYIMALVCLAIPAMALELAAGNAFRGGTVTAFNKISRRMRGTGFALNYVGFVVSIYFIPIISWGMVYLQLSGQDPLPWAGNTQDFFMKEVVSQIPADESGRWVTFTGLDFDGRLVGWNTFLWFLVWLCMFRGTGWTGRVVYFTMGLPLVVICILIGRGCSLENAGEGIKYYFGTFRGEELSKTKVWQDAVGQVFYSTGVGFGFYTAYASYNAQFANAAQDAVILCCTNACLEAIMAFAVFGIVGFLGMDPSTDDGSFGSYDLGFVTYPEAFVQMPGSQFFSALFFFTLMVVGVSSTFVMLDAVITLILDSNFGRKWSRAWVCTGVVLLCYLLSLPNLTQFGYDYMDGIDRWINGIGLVFVVWAEAISATTLYRFEDPVSQVGMVSWGLYTFNYFFAHVVGIAIGHTVSPPIGAGVGFGIFFIGSAVSVLLAKTPDVPVTARLFKGTGLKAKIYYLAFYSGNQLRHDLNSVIGCGGNWTLPAVWAALLKYVSGPILFIILSLAYPTFQDYENNPVHIMGWIIAHFLLLWCAVGLLMPKWFEGFIVAERRDDWKQPLAPCVLRDTTEGEIADGLEDGSHSPSIDASGAAKEKSKKHNDGTSSSDGDDLVRGGSSAGEAEPPTTKAQ